MPSMTSRRLAPHAVPTRGMLGAGVAAAAAAAGLLATAAPASAAALYPQHYVLKGSTGYAVAEIQNALGIPADGVFGRVTKAAVIAFQKRDGIEVDGVVGPQTWGALFGSWTVSAYRPTYTPSYSSERSYAPATTPATSYAPVHTYTATRSYSTTTTTTSYSSSGGYSIPSSIVKCESGGNYGAVNPSSGAGGAYQILPSTWAAYGGTGLPQNASPAEQNAIAAKIYAAQGASAWVCR